ncbi:MAG: glycosyltransferase [Lysobacterales bacterium]
MRSEPLQQLYRAHTGKVADKWGLYLEEYERLFADFRLREVRLMEIGVQNGGSLEIWAKYFSAARAIVGCDIDPECADLDFEDPRISVVVGDVNDDIVQDKLLGISSEYDIIIDDGSHESGDVVAALTRYFASVAQGGLYVIEDLHCGYWASYGGGLFHPYSSVSFLKALADILNFDYWGVEKKREGLLDGFCSKYGVKLDTFLLQQIHSIKFANSMCVIRKCPAMENRLGPRVIAGTLEPITHGRAALARDEELAIRPQAGNPFATRAVPPAEELPVRLQEIEEQARQLQELRQLLIDREATLDDERRHRKSGEATLARLYQSRSWRLTSPLREAWRFVHFDEEYYLKQNPDVAQSGMDPFLHYESYGRQEGRRPRPHSLLGRAGGMFAAFRHSIRFEGGLLPSMRSLYTVLQGEGLAGVQNRVSLVASRSDRNNYVEWVRRFDTLSEADRDKLRASVAACAEQPLISVLMPTYNTDVRWLREAVDSVRRQLYANWELCIADDASTDQAVRSYLQSLPAEDARIKVVFRKQNGHISIASNSALELCTGEWVGLLDHDDVLAETALFYVAEAITQNPDVQLIYSDEDKFVDGGLRCDPYFKCDWNPDLFYSHNMISHFGVYRRALVEEIGGFRAGFEGSQDHDLALRYIERIDPATIHHLPRVLYHWRKHPGSTAQQSTAKPYAATAGENAIGEHLSRLGVDAEVAWIGHGYRVRYSLPPNPPLVSLIIPTRNGLPLISKCIESIVGKTTYQPFEIVVVDNGSDDPDTLRYFKDLDRPSNVRIVRDDRPFNFASLNNLAAERAHGEVLGFINNDIEVISPDWLSEMVSLALQPDVGAVGAKLLYPDGSIQHAGVVLGIGGVGNHAFKGQPGDTPGYFGRPRIVSSYSALTAACMIVTKEAFLEVGGFDAENLAIAFNDVDLCLRLRESGRRNIWTPFAQLFHLESATRGLEDTVEKQSRFAAEVRYMQERWGHILYRDPAYSPNLTLQDTDFSLAWPPRTEATTGV